MTNFYKAISVFLVTSISNCLEQNLSHFSLILLRKNVSKDTIKLAWPDQMKAHVNVLLIYVHVYNYRQRKLQETLLAVQQLDTSMANLRKWLAGIEHDLSTPVIYQECSLLEIQHKLQLQQVREITLLFYFLFSK